MQPKIVFFIGSMRCGGAERVISILANHYCRLEWNVELVLLLDNNVMYELDERVHIVDMTQRGKSYYSRLPKWLVCIRRYVKQTQPNKIVSFIGRINMLVLTACAGLNIPVIVSERNDPKHDGRGKYILKYCNWIYKKADRIVFQTKYEQGCFSNKLKNGVIISNPVSMELEPKYTERPFEIVTAGRLLPQKNQKMLIEAIAKMNNSQVCLKIYGEGALRNELQNRISELKINAELCGSVSNLHERINGAGVFVLCSEFEGLSNALIEAMMLGIPCISTDYPGANELIVDGKNGLLVPCQNADRLAEAIDKLIVDEELRKRLSSEAIKSAEKYKVSSVLKQWEEIIGE